MGLFKDILSVLIDENFKNNLYGLELDLVVLGINDIESVNMDVFDWLDVIMFFIGLILFSVNVLV